jgi:hypothetical protein
VSLVSCASWGYSRTQTVHLHHEVRIRAVFDESIPAHQSEFRLAQELTDASPVTLVYAAAPSFQRNFVEAAESSLADGSLRDRRLQFTWMHDRMLIAEAEQIVERFGVFVLTFIKRTRSIGRPVDSVVDRAGREARYPRWIAGSCPAFRARALSSLIRGVASRGRNAMVSRFQLACDVAGCGDGLKTGGESKGRWVDGETHPRAVDVQMTKTPARRPRHVTPTTVDGERRAEEFEFLNAIEQYKREHGRPFPTWAEVLEVAHGLGYRRA